MDWSSLTAFDVVALVILGFSAFVGLRRGFVTEVLTLLSWAGAIFVTLWGLSWGLQDYGRSIIQPNALADIITAVMTFIVSLFVLRYVAALIGDMTKDGPVGFVDRGLGTAFGLLRGLLVVSTGYLLITYFVSEENQPDWVKEANLKPYAAYGADALRYIVPNLMDRDETRSIINDMSDGLPSGDSVRNSLEESAREIVTEEARESLSKKLEDLIDEAENESEAVVDPESDDGSN